MMKMYGKTGFLRFCILLLHLAGDVRCAGEVPDSPPPQCTIKCATSGIGESKLNTPDGQVISQRNRCMIQGVTGAEVCSIDVHDTLPYLDRISQKSTVMHYVMLHCIQRIRLVVRNANFISNKNVIGYLLTNNCDIHWLDLETYAGVFDLRFLHLQDRRELQNALALSSKEANAIPGVKTRYVAGDLSSLGSLIMINTNMEPQPFPAILLDYKWSNLAELAIFKCVVNTLPTVLQKNLPNLQSLELVFCNVTQPPVVFPWNSEEMQLPLKLTRKPVFDHDFDLSLGIITRPNAYPRQLVLKDNNITDLKAYTFQGCLQKMDLSHNAIESISATTFAAVTCLQSLLLNVNKLTTIPEQSFSTLVNLTTLDLSNNRIFQLMSPDLFKGLPQLTVLDLSYNNIQQFGSEIFLPLTTRDNKTSLALSLGSNALVCDCTALWLMRWLKENGHMIKDMDNVTCETGPGNGSMLVNVNETLYICDAVGSFSSYFRNDVKSTVVMLIISVMILIGAGLIYKCRNRDARYKLTRTFSAHD